MRHLTNASRWLLLKSFLIRTYPRRVDVSERRGGRRPSAVWQNHQEDVMWLDKLKWDLVDSVWHIFVTLDEWTWKANYGMMNKKVFY